MVDDQLLHLIILPCHHEAKNVVTPCTNKELKRLNNGEIGYIGANTKLDIGGKCNQDNQISGRDMSHIPLNNETTTIINNSESRSQEDNIICKLKGLKDTIEHAKKAHIYLLCSGVVLLVLNLVGIGMALSIHTGIKEARLDNQHETHKIISNTDNNLISVQMMVETARQKNIRELRIIIRDTRDLLTARIEAESLMIVNQNADARRATHGSQMEFMEKMAERQNLAITSIKEVLKDNREIMYSHVTQACRE